MPPKLAFLGLLQVFCALKGGPEIFWTCILVFESSQYLIWFLRYLVLMVFSARRVICLLYLHFIVCLNWTAVFSRLSIHFRQKLDFLGSPSNFVFSISNFYRFGMSVMVWQLWHSLQFTALLYWWAMSCSSIFNIALLMRLNWILFTCRWKMYFPASYRYFVLLDVALKSSEPAFWSLKRFNTSSGSWNITFSWFFGQEGNLSTFSTLHCLFELGGRV